MSANQSDYLSTSASPAPTTRTLALRIRDEGAAAALDQAQLRADAARYQEVTCRSALNAVKGMPFNWTLNPYRGCTHACHYCFARRYQTQFELGPGDEFSSVIFVKTNLVDVLRAELDHPSWTREQVAVGTATDPYQPIEGHYKLHAARARSAARGRTPIGLVTKGPMVVRDRDVLADMSTAAGATVYMSVPTVDEHAWSALEPGTAHPLQRLRAVRQLRDAGVNVGVLMAPLVPGFMHRAGAARSHHQGHRRPRCGLRRRERDVPQGRDPRSLPRLHPQRVPADARRLREALSRPVRARRLRRPRFVAMVSDAAEALRRQAAHAPGAPRGDGEERRSRQTKNAACEQAAFEW